jgi:hypothetical protein
MSLKTGPSKLYCKAYTCSTIGEVEIGVQSSQASHESKGKLEYCSSQKTESDSLNSAHTLPGFRETQRIGQALVVGLQIMHTYAMHKTRVIQFDKARKTPLPLV